MMALYMSDDSTARPHLAYASGGVHTSTMSAHNRNRRYYPSEEEVPLDGPNVYGLTKGPAENICRYFAREFDMSLAALRISGPRNRERHRQGGVAGNAAGRRHPLPRL